MREAISIFQKGFTAGLAPSPYYNTQVETLNECYNLVPSEAGIKAREEVFEPELEFPGRPWPFPALYRQARRDLIFLDNEVGLWENQGYRPIFSHTWKGLPHIADFMDTVIWATPAGAFISLKNGHTTMGVGGAIFHTCCNFKGQLVVGDCALPLGPHTESCQDPTNTVQVGGPDIVAWSKIGAVDWEYTLGNEVGWAPMPWPGAVRRVLPLKDEVVVYCDNGVAKLRPAQTPTQTFGVVEFGDIGILNRDCVDGSYGTHIFLGNDYSLYSIQPERALSEEGKAPKRLGYSYLLKDLKDPVVTYDSSHNHWWVGDSERCYIYTGYGLGESSLSPTHLSHVDGKLWGYTFGTGDRQALIGTSPLSFNFRGIKTLMNVEADVECSERVYGRAGWKSNYSRPFRWRPFVLLDPRGSFFPVVAGSELKVQMWAPEFKDFILSKLLLHYKTTDKTFSRGHQNANSSSEQADS